MVVYVYIGLFAYAIPFTDVDAFNGCNAFRSKEN